MSYSHDANLVCRTPVGILTYARVWRVTVKWQAVFCYPHFAMEITLANGNGKNRSIKYK